MRWGVHFFYGSGVLIFLDYIKCLNLWMSMVDMLIQVYRTMFPTISGYPRLCGWHSKSIG
jgi:hypothetical protein